MQRKTIGTLIFVLAAALVFLAFLKPADRSSYIDQTNQLNQSMNTEAIAVPGKQVSVHYTGRLENGTVFDSSIPRGEPITFTLGAGQVIPGWDQGISGMRVGEKKTFTIPPELGYGNVDIHQNPYDPSSPVIIPANSTLIFDVELVKVF